MSDRKAQADRRQGFTLIEIMVASAISAGILAALFAFFGQAIHARNQAVHGVREAQLRARAANTLREDLRNGYLSGGTLACTLVASRTAPLSKFPGYLRFTTTTGVIYTGASGGTGLASSAQSSGSGGTGANGNRLPTSEVQEVEYYIDTDPDGSPEAGVLVRAASQDLLSSIPQPARQEQLLTRVTGMEVQMYDGQNWSDAFDASVPSENTPVAATPTTASAASGTSTGTTAVDTVLTVPSAVRVRIHQAADETGTTPPPLEILVPWLIQPSMGASGDAAASAASTVTGGVLP